MKKKGDKKTDKKDVARSSEKRKYTECFGLSTAQPQRMNKIRINPPEEDEVNLHNRV